MKYIITALALAGAVCVSVADALVAPISGPVVDLDYAKYEGYYDDVHNLHVWKSIRYAAPPVGKLRWQAPQPPLSNQCHGRAIEAVKQPPRCPQSGAFGTPYGYGFNSAPGNEDCLFLNVYAAPGASRLPVLFWIHGGGYAVFGATYNPSEWMGNNNNDFITVEIQYRLGAFGYLASPDVKEHGKLNAGLLDQRYALEWVQKHVAKFGGDPNRVTIGGESSGAGSVMYHTLAYGGKEANLFNNIIASSPYSPAVYNDTDPIPVGNYELFAELVGCGKNSPYLKQNFTVFECLVAADSDLLQNASGLVSTSRGYFGTFAFVPVIDGDFVQELPSQQLLKAQVSGKRLLVGSNANEGFPLTNPSVTSRADYSAFISKMFPLFTPSDAYFLDEIYQINRSLHSDNKVRFDTIGDRGPTALIQSGLAIGIQQSAFNIAAETTFQCPAQWLAEAFSVHGRQAWKYQYSLTPSFHGADVSAYFPDPSGIPTAEFRYAFHRISGNFIVNDSPVISLQDATGNVPNATAPEDSTHLGNIRWPPFSLSSPWQMDLNTTGGEVSLTQATSDFGYYVRSGKGIVNTFRLTNAWTWEGGRGPRCAFWRAVAPRVPQ